LSRLIGSFSGQLYYISQRLPLEKPLKLKQDVDEFDLDQDEPTWTADTLLTAYAVQQSQYLLLVIAFPAVGRFADSAPLARSYPLPPLDMLLSRLALDHLPQLDNSPSAPDRTASTISLLRHAAPSPSCLLVVCLTYCPATSTGFITAKAGRPDLYRAGAQILRSLHTSAVPWGFRPPFRGDVSNQGQQEGVWIKDFVAKASTDEELRRDARRAGAGSDDDYSGSETDGRDDQDDEEDESEEVSEEEELASANRGAVAAVKSAFAGLTVEGGEDDDDDEDESDEA
jgi:hypothetical protein